MSYEDAVAEVLEEIDKLLALGMHLIRGGTPAQLGIKESGYSDLGAALWYRRYVTDFLNRRRRIDSESFDLVITWIENINNFKDIHHIRNVQSIKERLESLKEELEEDDEENEI